MPRQFNLDDDEPEILARILTSYLGDLRMEISNTDSSNMREALHREEDAIKSMLQRLAAGDDAGRSA